MIKKAMIWCLPFYKVNLFTMPFKRTVCVLMYCVSDGRGGGRGQGTGNSNTLMISIYTFLSDFSL